MATRKPRLFQTGFSGADALAEHMASMTLTSALVKCKRYSTLCLFWHSSCQQECLAAL